MFPRGKTHRRRQETFPKQRNYFAGGLESMREIWYNTHGTCSKQIHIIIDDNDIVEKVEFIGGCTGNLQGIAALAKGQSISTLVHRLKGIQCRNGTSCPDQLARALFQALKKEVNVS